MPKEARPTMSFTHSASSTTLPYPQAQPTHTHTTSTTTSSSASTHRNAAIWSTADDEVLLRARASGLNWQPIASKNFPGKTANACRKRHERLIERRHVDDWDSRKLELLAQEYLACRREMWEVLAARLGERWNVVEAKCMEKGLKPLQTTARTAQRKASSADHHQVHQIPQSHSHSFCDDRDRDRGISDHNSDSGIVLCSGSEPDLENETETETEHHENHNHNQNQNQNPLPTTRHGHGQGHANHAGYASHGASASWSESHSRQQQRLHQEHMRSRSLPLPLPLPQYQPPPPRTMAGRAQAGGELCARSMGSVVYARHEGEREEQRFSPETETQQRFSIQSVLSPAEEGREERGFADERRVGRMR